MKFLMLYFKKLFIAIDQLINTLFNGMPDETISASIYRNKDRALRWLIAYKVINNIFFWQKDHCKEAWESEINRKHIGY